MLTISEYDLEVVKTNQYFHSADWPWFKCSETVWMMKCGMWHEWARPLADYFLLCVAYVGQCSTNQSTQSSDMRHTQHWFRNLHLYKYIMLESGSIYHIIMHVVTYVNANTFKGQNNYWRCKTSIKSSMGFIGYDKLFYRLGYVC